MEEKRIYGYVRCSSTDQNEDRQMIALQEASVPEKIFSWISSQERILTAQTIRSWCRN